MQVCKPYHYAMVEAVDPCKLHPTFMSYKYEVLITFNCWGWAYGCTFTPLSPQTFPRFGRVGWNPRWCKFANHATLQWLRLQNLSNCIPHSCHTYMGWLSIFNCWEWAYGCSLTPLLSQMFPRFGEWAESLGDVSMQAMPLCNGWGCRAFQTAYHIHVIPI